MASLLFGIPTRHLALLHAAGFACGDPCAYLVLPDGRRVFVCRDIELDRARAQVQADACLCPWDVLPRAQLSGDRATATAQAAAELLRRSGATRVTGDPGLPLLAAEACREAGVEVELDPTFGVLARRRKSAREIALLREAQGVTEQAMRLACGLVVSAVAGADGLLRAGGEALTSERVRGEVAMFLARQGYADGGGAIVSQGAHGADCHHHGAGPLRTGLPVIVDIFPQNQRSHYWGDCTRTVVHGAIPDKVRHMHAAVLKAKAAAEAILRPGAEAEAVHRATCAALLAEGYPYGPLPKEGDPARAGAITLPHGTGHGVGLEVHEPILLDVAGGTILEDEVFTVEPGLYGLPFGGVRVEDMLVVRAGGAENLNTLGVSLEGEWAK